MRMNKVLNVGLLALLAALPLQADRLFTTGFEENDLTNTMWSSSTATAPVIGTTRVHSGTYSARVGSSERDVIKTFGPTYGAAATLWARFYVNHDTFAGSGFSAMLQFRSGGGTSGLNVRYDLANNKWGIIAPITGENATIDFAVSLDTWYRVEVELLLNDSPNGTAELRLYEGEGTTQVSGSPVTISGADTLPTSVVDIRFGNIGGATWGIIYVDDFGLNDEGGTFQVSFPGPGKNFLIEPSGDNTVNWTKDGSAAEATNWEGVDDLPGAPDDGTTYNSATTNITDKLDLSNLGAEVPSDADIILVDVYGRQGSNGTTGTRRITYELWDEADAQTTGPLVDCKINGWRITGTNEHLVFDAGSRSKANIDSFRVGYQRNIGGGNEMRITAQWINVEWTEAAAAPAFRPKVVVY